MIPWEDRMFEPYIPVDLMYKDNPPGMKRVVSVGGFNNRMNAVFWGLDGGRQYTHHGVDKPDSIMAPGVDELLDMMLPGLAALCMKIK